jgi:hypothetical protein
VAARALGVTWMGEDNFFFFVSVGVGGATTVFGARDYWSQWRPPALLP